MSDCISCDCETDFEFLFDYRLDGILPHGFEKPIIDEYKVSYDVDSNDPYRKDYFLCNYYYLLNYFKKHGGFLTKININNNEYLSENENYFIRFHIDSGSHDYKNPYAQHCYVMGSDCPCSDCCDYK